MIYKKAGGRRKKKAFTWNGKEIEIVKSFNYLGYSMRNDGGDRLQIESLVRKANAVIGKVWGIAERTCRDN